MLFVAQVCDTYYNATANGTEANPTNVNGTFERETMFILTTGDAVIYNSPPRLNSTNNISIEEDSGMWKKKTWKKDKMSIGHIEFTEKLL